jgi:hypothetical protein
MNHWYEHVPKLVEKGREVQVPTLINKKVFTGQFSL